MLKRKEKIILSAKNQRWRFTSFDEKQAHYYCAHYDLPFAVARILSSRDIPPADMDNFVVPKLKNLMPSPFILADMDIAVDVVGQSIVNNETIGVFGDYDVDGGTSSAIMKRFFDMVQTPCHIHIPDRMTEGYGPNIEAFRKLSALGAKTLVTVDCGSSAPDVMKMAQSDGLNMVIIDHHLTDGTTDGALATVNPNRQDDMSGLDDLTAAGVSFLFCAGLTSYLRDKDYFNDTRPVPNLLSLLDLVALGTICDVAPLTGLNRAFITQGLKVINSGHNIGLRALSVAGRITGSVQAYHCGFVLGPRINAGGRVGRASAGYDLLTTDCPITAEKLATELDNYNLERKTMEDLIKQESFEQIDKYKLYNDAVIIAYAQNWHPGIVGIVASRIKEHYQKPAFILGGDDGFFKGSGRSISGVDIGTAVRNAKNQDLLINGGGHKMAAGISIYESQIQPLRDFFNTELSQDVSISNANYAVKIDSELLVSGANIALFHATQKLEPFGVGNPAPVFCLRDVKVTFSKIIGENHLKLRFSDGTGEYVNAVCFNCVHTELGDLLMQKNQKIDVIGTLKADTYHNGNDVQFIIDDASMAGVF